MTRPTLANVSPVRKHRFTFGVVFCCVSDGSQSQNPQNSAEKKSDFKQALAMYFNAQHAAIGVLMVDASTVKVGKPPLTPVAAQGVSNG